MASKDLRQWLSDVEELGELKVINGADCNHEIGAISAVNVRRSDCPALLFDNIKGYPEGYRVITASLASKRRIEVSLDLPRTETNLELVELYRQKLQEWEDKKGLFPFEVVKSGPILENVHSGEDIDIFEFPVPKWHEKDGGPYIGTGDAVITRDPDTGEINLGCYRIMVHDNKTTALYISPGKDGRIHYEKYHAKGEPCPVAIVAGSHPLLWRSIASSELPYGSEYNYLGAIWGEPFKVIEEEVTGLPIPADAEIVIAGWCPPGKTMIEGPFGEWTGYYASKERLAPIVEVKRIYHRDNPIILGSPPSRPSEATLFKAIKDSGLIYNALIKSGVPDVKGVWTSEFIQQLMVVVSIKQRYAGHAKQAALLASQNRPAVYHGRYVVVVDEDIDPTNIGDVLWAIGTRSDPEKDIDIVRRAWSTPLDTTIRKPSDAFFNSRAIIDACKPFEWISEFPEAIELSPELARHVKEKWGKVLGM